MKKLVCLIFLTWLSLDSVSAQYPPEWVRYTFGGYVYDIQSDTADGRISETSLKESLLNVARTNVAKQIRIEVSDYAELTKRSDDRDASVSYFAQTKFSTDVNLKLVETKTAYDSDTGTAYAIAYIDRDAARNYYKNELSLVYNRISNSMALADNFVSAGFKSKAQSELEASLKRFGEVDEPLFWMNIFGASQSELTEWQERFNAAEQSIKGELASLKHATVICLTCHADLFGKSYPTLQNELKGLLSADGCSFTDKPSEADWVIVVECACREHSTVHVGNTLSYFSYVNASISIDKMLTGQRIYEDEVTVKGGHIFGYTEAARAGYKDIKQQIGKIIKDNIEQ